MTKAYFTRTGKVHLYDGDGRLVAAVTQPIQEIIITVANRWTIILKGDRIPNFLYADLIIMETL